MKALVVLSGGQDSTTCLYWAKHHKPFEEVRALTFDYGQAHASEISAAVHIASAADVKHEVVRMPGILQSTSPLTDKTAKLERYENFEQMEKVIGNRTELTFVPMRNALFAVLAANRAVAMGFDRIVLGICEADNANYPDCTENFLNVLNEFVMTALGRSYDVEFVAPLLFKQKNETVDLAMKLPGCMRALAFSHTSYDGQFPPTDNNHANVLRAEGFRRAGVADPLVVRAWSHGLMELPETENYDGIRNLGITESANRRQHFANWISQFS